ncbi:MAG: type II secretion system minor pseudopilin GspJ [Nevskia sp.]|nr:type II secretion system minor pseudopilin GspJ [Nevskia sp.]
MSRRQRPAAGYTLLELIVVIAVFAVFAAMAYGGLTTVLKARRGIEATLARTADYQKAYQRMRDDFLNAAPRTVRDSDGAPQAAFTFDDYNHRAEFTRGGWANPVGLPRATLERVSYFLDDSRSDDRRLVRRSWRVLDRAPQSEPVDLVLLGGVDQLKWRFLDGSLQWHDNWAAPGPAAAAGAGASSAAAAIAALPVPLAVEITLETRDWGTLRFLFRLGAEGYVLAPSMAAAAGGQANAGGTRTVP